MKIILNDGTEIQLNSIFKQYIKNDFYGKQNLPDNLKTKEYEMTVLRLSGKYYKNKHIPNMTEIRKIFTNNIQKCIIYISEDEQYNKSYDYVGDCFFCINPTEEELLVKLIKFQEAK